MKLVGRYQIHSRIGQGAMANVYRARDPEIQRDLAIKILNQQFRRDPECVARFLREARAAGSLSHGNIVTIYDVGEAQGFPYLAMELLIGEPLDKVIEKRGALPIIEVLNIGLQLADALRYAHDLGIVHRDVKPSNIVLCEDGQTVKLVDFGIAHVSQSGSSSEAAEMVKTQVGQVLGTPRYMSPEQALGQPLDGRSDLFSVGAILYELVTGASAFNGASVATLALQITSHHPAPIAVTPECPRGLRFVIEKLLAKQADKRFANGAQLVDALKAEQAALTASSSDNRGRRLPLHVRFAGVAGVVTAAVLTVSIGWVLDQQYRAMERVAVTSGASIASFVAGNTALPMMENAAVPPKEADWLPVQAFVKTAASDRNISELTIIDGGGIVRASANASLIGTHYSAPTHQERIASDPDVTVSTETRAGREFFRFTRPIIYSGRTVGVVDVKVGREALQAAADLTRTLLVGLGVIMFAVAFGLSFLAGRVMASPVRRLSAALRQAANGNLDFRISHSRKDDFGDLFDNFNALATDVQDRLDRQDTGNPAAPAAPLRDMAATMLQQSARPALEKSA